jgi:integrase
MAASPRLNLGERVARQTLVERPSYIASDDDLDPAFFPGAEPGAVVESPHTFQSQYFAWIDGLSNRACDPISPATLESFVSRAKTILSVVGPQTRLETFKNAAMHKFVEDAKAFSWKPATLAAHILVIKLIVASAVDEEGEQLFPRVWNRRVINAPRVERTKQKTPAFSREQIETLIREVKTAQERLLVCLLAGTGLRIGEARSIRVQGDSSHTSWDQKTAAIVVRNSLFRNRETGRAKTDAGRRTVYLHSALNKMIAEFVLKEGRQTGSYLFQGKRGEPLKQSTFRNRLATVIPGAAPHSARRFHITHLRSQRVLEEIIKLRVGHSGQDMTDLYSQQNEEVCRAAIEAAGLGFDMTFKDINV